MPRISGPLGCERLYPHLWKTTYLDFKVEVLKRRFIIFSPQDRIQKLLRRFSVWLGYNCKAPVTNLWAWKSVTEWNSVTMSRFHDMEDQMFWSPMTSLRTWIEPITPIKRNGSSFIRKGMLKYLAITSLDMLKNLISDHKMRFYFWKLFNLDPTFPSEIHEVFIRKSTDHQTYDHQSIKKQKNPTLPSSCRDPWSRTLLLPDSSPCCQGACCL